MTSFLSAACRLLLSLTPQRLGLPKRDRPPTRLASNQLKLAGCGGDEQLDRDAREPGLHA